MEFQAYVLYIEIQLICMALLLFNILDLRRKEQIKGKGFYCAFIWCVFIMAFAEIFFGLNEIGTVLFSETFFYIINLIYTAAGFLGCYFWFVFSEILQGNKSVSNRRNRIFCAVPLVIVLVLMATNSFHHLFFTIKDGHYLRGDYLTAVYLIAALLVLYSSFSAIKKAFQKKYFFKRVTFFLLASYAVVLVVSAVVQIFSKVQTSALVIGATFLIVVVHEAENHRMITRDSLTGINNRIVIERYLDHAFSINDPHVFLLMMDVNNFKKINDSFGHVCGDDLLKQVAHALEISVSAPYVISRFGGDEFVVAGSQSNMEEIEQICQSIRETVKKETAREGFPNGVDIAIGVGTVSEEVNTIPDLLRVADEKMYQNKQEMKKS